MVPNPYGLYDDDVRSRTLWACREGFVVGGILLFWVVIAVVLSAVLMVLSVPFALFRFGAPGLPVTALVWTIVGPLAFLNASLYVFVRAGTVIVDHYRSGGGLAFEPGPKPAETTEAEVDTDDSEGDADDIESDADESEGETNE